MGRGKNLFSAWSEKTNFVEKRKGIKNAPERPPFPPKCSTSATTTATATSPPVQAHRFFAVGWKTFFGLSCRSWLSSAATHTCFRLYFDTLSLSLSLTICHTHSLTLYRIFNSTHVLGGGCRGWCAELSKDFQENKFCGFSLRSGWEREVLRWEREDSRETRHLTFRHPKWQLDKWQNGNWTNDKMTTGQMLNGPMTIRQMTKWQLVQWLNGNWRVADDLT